MSTNNNFEDIMREILREKNQAIMSEYEETTRCYNDEKSFSIDEKVIKKLIEYDKNEKQKRRKNILSILSKVAIIIIGCTITITFAFPDDVEAFRTKIISTFFNNHSGSVSLRGEQEIDMLKDCKNYYYPKYMLDGYELLGAEKMGERIVMVFVTEDRTHKLEVEQLPINSNVSVDTEHVNIDNVKINYYEGIYTKRKEHDYVVMTWASENKIISIYGDTSIAKEEYIKIAENFEFVER